MQPTRQVIRADRAFDGVRPLPGGLTVFVEDGRITGTEPGRAPAPEGWQVRDFPGATPLPCHVDMHCHLGADSHDGALERMATDDAARLEEVIDDSLGRQLAAGVTTVRDLGDRDWTVVRRRDRARSAGTAGPPSPTIVAAGPPITTPDGHCAFMGGTAPGGAGTACGGAGTGRAGRRRGRGDGQRRRAHALHQAVGDHHALGGEAGAVLDAVGARVEGLSTAARACACTVTGRPAACAASTITPSSSRVNWQRATSVPGQHAARMHRAGVRLASGADSGINSGKPHGVLPAAVAQLAEGGVPADAALATATSLVADACGLADRKGRVRRGFDADPLLSGGDPFTDPAALSCPVAVLAAALWASTDPRSGPE
jgi:imidazolonepropionase-like amidohydrolase